MDRLLVGREYASHLTDADLALLASAAAASNDTGRLGGATGPGDAPRLRGDPETLLRLLEHPGGSRAVLDQGEGASGRAAAPPPLPVLPVFGHRAPARPASAGHRTA